MEIKIGTRIEYSNVELTRSGTGLVTKIYKVLELLPNDEVVCEMTFNDGNYLPKEGSYDYRRKFIVKDINAANNLSFI